MSLKLIETPPYSVNLSQYHIKPSKNLNTDQNINSTVEFCFELICKTAAAPVKAAWATLRYSPLSFRNIVFTPMTITSLYAGRQDYSFTIPANPVIAIIRIANWILSLAGCFVSTTFNELRKIYVHEDRTALLSYAEDGINLDHIKSTFRKIDVSHVPENVQLENLLELFEKVNLSDPAQPGYVAAPEGKSEKKLREGLKYFVKCVRNRAAITGAPPAYDAPKVEAFYQQIEDAVRASLYKVESDLEAFNQKNPNKESWTEATQKEYKNVLEDRSRLVVELAGSGNSCATRFMGEAMECYYNFCGVISGQTLQDSLVGFLAQKRLEVAKGQVLIHFGQDTHHYTNYMQCFGGILGLPGTENIIEHLSSALSHEKYLPYFFEKYTVDYVIDAIQEKIKNNLVFREKIQDWLAEQINGWVPADDDDDTSSVASKISNIQNNHEVKEHEENKKVLETLSSLLNYLSSNNIQLPTCDKAEDFIEKLIEENEAAKWLKDQNYTNSDKETLKDVFKMFEEKILPLIKSNQTFDLGDLKNDLIKKEKIKQIINIAYVSPSQAERMLDGSMEKVKEILSTNLSNERKKEFLEALGLTQITKDGLSKEIIEWLLVSQGIFLPQSSLESSTLVTREITVEDNDIVSDVSLSVPSLEITKILSPYLNGKKLSSSTLHNKRVQLLKSNHYELSGLTKLHKKVWKANPKLLANEYPAWKRISLCDIPSRVSNVLDHDFTRFTTGIAAIAIGIYSTYKFYYLTERIIPQYILPIFINKTPVKAVQIVNIGISGFQNMKNHPFKVVFAILFAKAVLYLTPLECTRKAARYISADIVVMNTVQFQQLVFHQIVTLFWLGNSVRKAASTTCKMIAKRYTDPAYNSSRKRFVEAARLIHKKAAPAA